MREYNVGVHRGCALYKYVWLVVPLSVISVPVTAVEGSPQVVYTDSGWLGGVKRGVCPKDT